MSETTPQDASLSVADKLAAAFHEHLEHCSRCAARPFDLCLIGAVLLRSSQMAALRTQEGT